MGSVGNNGNNGGGGRSFIQTLHNRLDKASFKDEGNGQWTLDTGMGGGQILDESDGRLGEYGRMRAYSVRAWDSNYSPIGEEEVYSSLNAAKQAIKNKIKSTL